MGRRGPIPRKNFAPALPRLSSLLAHALPRWVEGTPLFGPRAKKKKDVGKKFSLAINLPIIFHLFFMPRLVSCNLPHGASAVGDQSRTSEVFFGFRGLKIRGFPIGCSGFLPAKTPHFHEDSKPQ